MITYKNISYSAKTFYGVKFESGEVKSVKGFINDPSMVRVFTKEKPKHAKVEVTRDTVQDFPRKKKKSNESEKGSVAETETKLESKEETTNGNPS